MHLFIYSYINICFWSITRHPGCWRGWRQGEKMGDREKEEEGREGGRGRRVIFDRLPDVTSNSCWLWRCTSMANISFTDQIIALMIIVETAVINDWEIALERHWKGTRRALANMKNGMGGAWVEENNKRRPSLDNCKLEPERHGKANRGKLTNNRSNYTRSITIIKLQQIGNNFRRAVWGLRDIREERPETLRIQTNNRYSLSRRKNALRSRWSCKNARICGTRTCGGAPITAPIQPEPIEIECVTYLIHQTLVIVPQNRPAKSARKIDRPPPSAGMMTGLPPPLENAQRFRYSLVVYYYYYFVFFRIEFTAHHSQS